MLKRNVRASNNVSKFVDIAIILTFIACDTEILDGFRVLEQRENCVLTQR